MPTKFFGRCSSEAVEVNQERISFVFPPLHENLAPNHWRLSSQQNDYFSYATSNHLHQHIVHLFQPSDASLIEYGNYLTICQLDKYQLFNRLATHLIKKN